MPIPETRRPFASLLGALPSEWMVVATQPVGHCLRVDAGRWGWRAAPGEIVEACVYGAQIDAVAGKPNGGA